MTCISDRILFELLNQEEWDWRDIWHEWVTEKVHAVSWWGNLKERVHWENLGVNGRRKLRKILNKSVGKAWSRLDRAQDREKFMGL